MQVKVFRNLTKGCYSIQARGPKGFRTVAHADTVELADVTFKVSEAGRQRVLSTGKKQVHAFVCGTLVQWHGELAPGADLGNMPTLAGCWRCPDAATTFVGVAPIRYNPRTCSTFMLDESPIYEAGRVFMARRGVFLEALTQHQYDAAEAYANALCDLRRAHDRYRPAAEITALRHAVAHASSPDDRMAWAAVDRVRNAVAADPSIQWTYQALSAARLFDPSKQ